MIETAEISLRAEIPKEARGWRNHESIRKWCRQYTLIDENQHARWLERISTDPTIKMFGIYCPASEPVGVCGLTSIDRVNQNAEFSLYICPERQRRGFGRKALALLFAHGFRDMNLNRIWGETYEGNPALAMFKSLGLRVEGLLREAYFRNGRFIDVTRVGILRSEFNA